MRIQAHNWRGFGGEGGPLIRVYRFGFVSIETISWKFARLIQRNWADFSEHVKRLAKELDE